MSVERHIKSIKIYAQTINTDSLKMDDLEFQENLEPREVANIPTPYNYYDIDLDKWIHDFGFENDFVLALDDTQLSGVVWKTFPAGRAPTFQFTIPGVLMVGDDQPPATPVPYIVTATQLFAYVKTVPSSSALIVEVNNNGSPIDTVTIAIGQHYGSTIINEVLSLNDILTVDINQADEIAADLTGQVRT